MLFKFMPIEPLGINRTSSIHPKILLATLRKNQAKGFTILEVLVTILVISGFLLGSLQATVLAVFLRIQAQDKQEATNWVQQDLELIRYQAFILTGTKADGTATTGADATQCTSTTLADKYGTRLQNTIVTAGHTVGQNTTINGTTKPYTVTRGYTIPTASPNILQISYTVAYASGHPRYKTASGADNTVTTLSTEVIPNAALSC